MRRQKRNELIRAIIAQTGIPGRWAVAEETVSGSGAVYVLIAEADEGVIERLQAALKARDVYVNGVNGVAVGPDRVGPASLVIGSSLKSESFRKATLTNARVAAREALGPAFDGEDGPK